MYQIRYLLIVPLQKSCSIDAYKANIAELIKSGKPQDQAVAIAHSTLRESCKAAGQPTPRTDSADIPVQRYDFSRLGKAKKTPQGFLKFDAAPTRVGVLKYQMADGSIRRELRPPEEVFKDDSLDTLAGAPLTDLHVNAVTPENVSSVAKGRLSEKISHDDTFVKGTVIIQDSNLIGKVDRGERKELSAGYTCRMDFSPGVWNGEAYDAVQRDIEYNHVAIGPSGWGRAGSDVALRLDGDDAAAFDTDVSNVIPNKSISGKAGNNSNKETTMKRSLRIDGVDYAAEADDALFQAFDRMTKRADDAAKETQKTISDLESRIDSLEKTAKTAQSELQAKFDSATKEVDELKKKLAEAQDPARLDSMVTARAELFTQARTVLGTNEKLDGLSDRQIKEKVLVKLDPESKFDGKDDGYVNGAFEYAIKKAVEKKADGASASRQFSSPTPPNSTQHTDAADPFDADRAYRDMVKRNAEAWKATS